MALYSETDLARDAAGYGALIATRQGPQVHAQAGRTAPQVIGTAIYDRVRDSFVGGLCAEVLVTRPLVCYRGWDDPGSSIAAAAMLGSWYTPLRPTIRAEFRRATAAAVRYASTGGGNRITQVGRFTIDPGAHLVVGRASPQSDVFQGITLPGGAMQFWLRRADFGYLRIGGNWDPGRDDA